MTGFTNKQAPSGGGLAFVENLIRK